MGKKRIGIIVAALALVLLASYYFYSSRELYGNDRESIVEVIQSIDGYQNKNIEILDIKDFNDSRYVGFLSNRNPSYMELSRNSQGNYIWKHIETASQESFSMFLPVMEDSKIMFVTNSENEIAKMQVDINGTTLEQTFTPFQATVTWVDLPPTNEPTYEYRNYRYFDKNGDLIN
ncbi:hypothetical protein [Radiobacillus deserti]|uniref:Uncharacterized protein n=1 Tax=Radiobacillus deserti TaxID=2594883 RepID=A0A516KJF2_9BACI|nr:hypothetical protein [Radiobacillus deserti]QDP41501.1 hypothetical protein FN924_15760 [Radiobacillus deserti]